LTIAGDSEDAISPDKGVSIAMTRALEIEAERLLSQRTRDIFFSPEMLRAFREKTWPQRSKVVRGWMVSVGLIAIMIVPLTILLSPDTFFASILLSGLVVPLLTALNYPVWRKPRGAAIEGLSLLLLMICITIAYGVLAAITGGTGFQRILTSVQFVNAVAIVVLPVEFIWSLALTASCLAIFLGFELFNPAIGITEATSVTLFYGLGIYAATMARKTQWILSQKIFLMGLRDLYRGEALKAANAQLEVLANRDPLTGLGNRRSAAAVIEMLWKDQRIAKSSIAFVMADIDFFKRLNDSAGHAAGDECIQRVAHAIEQTVRSGDDSVFRYGGEEFLIILTKTTPERAWHAVERIRCKIEALGIVNPGAPPANGGNGVVTMSLGVAFADDDAAPEMITRWADEALYDAKRSGRNATFLSTAKSTDMPPAESQRRSGDPPPRSVKRLA